MSRVNFILKVKNNGVVSESYEKSLDIDELNLFAKSVVSPDFEVDSLSNLTTGDSIVSNEVYDLELVAIN